METTFENGRYILVAAAGHVIECLIDGKQADRVVCEERQIKYYTEVKKQ